MADIKFYDFEFNPLHLEPFAVSANFTVKFCGEGSFELHFPKNFSAKRELLNNFSIKDGKGICMVYGSRTGIVTGMRIENDFAVYGKTCDFILRKKVVLPYENLKIYNPYNLCSHFLGNAFSSIDPITLKQTSETFDNIASSPLAEKSPKTLYDTLCGIISDAGLGYRMVFDTSAKKWVFELLKPGVSESTFICDSAAAYDISMTFDTKNYFSHTLSKNSSGTYEFTKKHDGTGLYRWEELSKTEEDLLCDLDFKFINTEFEKDYFLGDKFKIRTENGTFRVTVTEVSISYEGDIAKQCPKLKISKEE